MIIRLFLFAGLLLGATGLLSGQYTLSRNYTAKDGLGFTESFMIRSDAEGYLWTLSTNDILTRFDGREFTVMDTEFIGSTDAPTLASMGKELLLMEKSSNIRRNIRILRGDTTLLLSGLPRGVVMVYNLSEDDRLYFSRRDTLYGVDRLTAAVDTVFRIPYTGSATKLWYTLLPEGKVVVRAQVIPHYNSLHLGTRLAVDTVPVIRNLHGGYHVLPDGRFMLIRHRSPFIQLATPDGRITDSLQLRDQESYGTNNVSIRVYGDRIVYAYVAVRGNDRFAIALVADLATPFAVKPFACSPFEGGANGVMSLSNIDPNNFWIADHGGIHHFDPLITTFRERRPEMISSLHAIGDVANGNVVMGGYGTGFTVFDGTQLQRTTWPGISPVQPVMPGSIKDAAGNRLFLLERSTPNNLVRFGTDGSVLRLPLRDGTQSASNGTGFHFSKVRLPRSSPVLADRDYPPETDSVALIAVSMASFRSTKGMVKGGSIQLISDPVGTSVNPVLIGIDQGVDVKNVLCTAQDRAGRIWFAHSRTGMGFYDPATDRAITWTADSVGDPGAYAMVVDAHDRLWLGSPDGLYYFDDASSIAPQLTPHLRARRKSVNIREMEGAFVASLLLRGDTLIVGHKAGISFIDVSSTNVEQPPTVTLGSEYTGLGESEQNALLVDNQGLLWAGGTGAIRVDYKAFLGRDRRMRGAVKLAVRGLTKPLTPDAEGQFTVPRTDRSITLWYEPCSADQMRDNLYADLYLYDEDGSKIDSLLNASPADRLTVPRLAPGNYVFTVVAIVDNQPADRQSVPVKLVAYPSESWWFYPLILLAILTLFTVFAVWRIQTARTRQRIAEVEQRLTETQLQTRGEQVQTLINTINPHFVANAIQWIQSAVSNQLPAEEINLMGHYLGGNLRAVYSKSSVGKVAHSLLEEFAVVEGYFRIVNLKYEDKFNFVLPPQEVLERYAHVNVFLLQFQIHAENAMEHGLLNRQIGNNITIALHDEGDYLRFTVTDDGGGKTRASQLRRYNMRQRSGVGTSILQKLADIFNQTNPLPIRTTMVSDLHPEPDGSGQYYGTEVTILIPKSYNYAPPSNRS